MSLRGVSSVHTSIGHWSDPRGAGNYVALELAFLSLRFSVHTLRHRNHDLEE